MLPVPCFTLRTLPAPSVISLIVNFKYLLILFCWAPLLRWCWWSQILLWPLHHMNFDSQLLTTQPSWPPLYSCLSKFLSTVLSFLLLLLINPYYVQSLHWSLADSSSFTCFMFFSCMLLLIFLNFWCEFSFPQLGLLYIRSLSTSAVSSLFWSIHLGPLMNQFSDNTVISFCSRSLVSTNFSYLLPL